MRRDRDTAKAVDVFHDVIGPPTQRIWGWLR
jgi:hypothetical protein